MRILGYFCRFLVLLILFFSIVAKVAALDAGRETSFSYINPGSPVYESPSGFDLYVGGYLQGDFLSIDNAPQLNGEANWRAGRPEIRFILDKNWQWIFSYDFATSRLIDANISYLGAPHLIFMAGQFSPVFGLENTSDTPAITFLELGLPVQLFSINYSPGGEIGYFKDPFTVYASFFGPGIGAAYHGRAPYGGALSVSFSPIHTKTRVFHLSLSGWQQGIDSSHTIDFSTIPEVMARNGGALIDTGSIGNVNNYQSIDVATAGVIGPFSAQGEYIQTWVNRQPGFSVLEFHGYYLTASYFLTGESRNYSFEDASFIDSIRVNHSYGAWEVAVRYSNLNLIDQNIVGGKEHNFTFGLNWYLRRFFVFKFNYIHARVVPNSIGANQTANFYVLRLQLLI